MIPNNDQLSEARSDRQQVLGRPSTDLPVGDQAMRDGPGPFSNPSRQSLVPVKHPVDEKRHQPPTRATTGVQRGLAPTVPVEMRAMTRASEYEDQGAQTPFDFRIRDLRHETLLSKILSPDILSAIREFFDKPDLKLQGWEDRPEDYRCIQGRLHKLASKWDNGECYACSNCSRRGHFCARVKEGGVIQLLPRYQKEHLTPQDMGFWKVT